MGNIQRTKSPRRIEQPALSLDRHVEDPERAFSFLSYLQFRTDNTLIGLFTVYIAFLFLLLTEFTGFLLRGATPGGELVTVLALFLAGGFLVTVAFQTVIFLARTIDALLSHVDELWRPAVPGLIVFLILGQPVLQISRYYFQVESIAIEILLAVGLLALSAGISAAALYVFPILRGINSTLLLIAALGGRAIMFPFEYREAYTGPVDFAAYLASAIVCTFFLFIALQQRYRLQLAPYYERFIVSRNLFLTGVAFTVAGCVAYFWLESVKVDPFHYINGDLVVRPAITGRFFVPGSLVLFCMIYWLIASVALNLINTDRFPEFLTRGRLYRAFAGAFAAFLIATAYLAFLFDSSAHRARIVQYGDVSAELLSLPGVLLDEDGDSNSAWPGGDPDDRDPCRRSDFAGRCLFPRTGTGMNGNDPGPRIERANFEIQPTAPARRQRRSPLGTGSVSRSIILTIAGPIAGPRFDLNGFFHTYARDLERPMHRSRFLLPINRLPEAMPALARSLDGVELRTGVERRSLFSELSEGGFRTICGGWIAGTEDGGYLNPAHDMDLDSGCQVHIDPESLAEQDPRFPKDRAQAGLLPVARAMHTALRKYREKRTVLWIHFDGRDLDVSGREPAVARAEFSRVIDALRKEGNLMVAALGSGETLSVPVWIFAKDSIRTPPAFDTFRHLVLSTAGASGVTPPPEGFEDDFTGILTTPWISATWASALFYRLNIAYPLITYKRKDDAVHIFDGITGARWVLPERKAER